MERGKLPGLAIALVKCSEIVWSRGYGYADLETRAPVTPETVFSVQSVTKPVVATALMQWHERGRFGLDDAVNGHLGPVRLHNEWEETNPVTVRHLLTHTSGLPVDLAAAPPTSERLVPLQDYLAVVAKTVRAPGEEMVYANWGYDIVGYLVGRFAGQSYDAYLREHVLETLEMACSGVEPPGNVATGYFLSVVDGRHHAAEPVASRTKPPPPAGALFSTVEDLARFLVAHLNGGVYKGKRVLDEGTVAEMHRLQARHGPLPSGMGLGFRVDRVSDRRLICHGGDGTAFTAFVGAYPQEKVGVALLLNMGRAQSARSVVANAALGMLLGDYRPFDRRVLQRRAADAEWTRLCGRYLSNYWGVEATLAMEDGLPSVNLEGGFVSRDEGERSYLQFVEEGVARAYDGPFDGFELAFEPGEGEGAPRFYGGVYPIRFERQGDASSVAELALDEEVDLVGHWDGTVASPLGPVPMTLAIADAKYGTVTALSGQDEPVEEFAADRGRVSGHVGASLPGLGDFRIFLRLNAAGGRLLGRVYARGGFGEVPMRAELTRR